MWPPLMGTPRPKKIVSHAAKRARDAMVENLGRRIAENYPHLKPNTAYKKIEKATGISLSSMQRIMSGETGPSIDTLADLAHHLGLAVADMLTKRMEAPLPAPPSSRGEAAQRLQRSSP